jgi:hypothetical protein
MLTPRAGTTDPSIWRTQNETYFDAWQDYVSCVTLASRRAAPPIHRVRATSAISKLLAPYQITNGGPIILWQVRPSAHLLRCSSQRLKHAQSENEYSGWQAPLSEDSVYEQELLKAWVRAFALCSCAARRGS